MGFELSWLFTLLGIAVGSVGVALSISWKLTMLLLYVIPLIFFSTRLFATVMACHGLIAHRCQTIVAAHGKRNIERARILRQSRLHRARSIRLVAYRALAQRQSVRTATVCLPCDHHLPSRLRSSYEQHLETSKWASLRKGAIFGTFFGWLYFICYLMYSTGFIAASLLRQYDGSDQLTISDILAVSSETSLRPRYTPCTLEIGADRFHPRGVADRLLRLVPANVRGDECSDGTYLSTNRSSESFCSTHSDEER